MIMGCVRTVGRFIVGKCRAIGMVGVLVFAATPLWAQTFEPTLTVGGGIQGSYVHTDTTGVSPQLDQFELDHLRLYFSGDITKDISAMINTDYTSSGDYMQVLDAVGQYHPSSKFNVWFGRFIPPSDRANFHGPFYSNEFRLYHDGVQDGYPSVYQGRDNGIAYWGDFKAGTVKIKASAGVFDGGSLNDGSAQVLWAARLQLDFWDPEGGYYLNSTYYGDKNLLALGGATEVQNDKTATTVDLLMERKVMNGGAFTIESEFSRYNGLGGYYPPYAKSEGGFGLVSFLFPKPIGSGKVEAIGKFAEAEFTDGPSRTLNPNYRQKTTDVELGYIVKQFDARFFAFGTNVSFNAVQKNYWQAGVGLQLQLSKQILGPK